ncbi:MAG: Gfo/Idh/MocA family oxidoreductase [Kiritimatiellae bacterium]|nr:Gfo/Idh/MocA family oxidoreductase [Kiritimatiellia bacterium]
MSNPEYQRPPVKVAIMGCGRSMFASHYPVYKAHPALFKVVCACDTIKERRDMIAKDFPDCRMFRQFSDMLDERNIDLVDIATGSLNHKKHAMMSLEKGFWTLLETPMALQTDEALLIRGAAAKAKNKLIVMQRGMFDPDFLIAKAMMSDPRLGEIHEIVMRKEDYVRIDDWQAVKRMGGGATYYAMTDMLIQALRLLPSAPIQMWSDLKRIASLGDAEDYAHVMFKTRSNVSADLAYSGGCLKENRSPSFSILGERGEFSIMPGATQGMLTVIEPNLKLPRRRSSVRTPPLSDLHEQLPVVRIPISLPAGTPHGETMFWKHVYNSVRTAAPFPITIEESIDAVRFAHLMKKTSPFGMGK